MSTPTADAPEPLELFLASAIGALLPYGLKHDAVGAHAVAAITTAIFNAYQLGAADAIKIAPWECYEVTWKEHPPTPAELNVITAKGWRPWDMANVMMPKVPGFTENNMLGYRVRFTRRMQPAPEAANDAG